MTELSYAVVTPARNEAQNIERLAESLRSQSIQPPVWLIVDNGSTDGTGLVLQRLAHELPFVRALSVPPPSRGVRRGGTIARVFEAGVNALTEDVDVIVKLDADVSMGPNYFERLLEAFADDASLGIASGSAWELEEGEWRQRHLTGASVWGASRAYRRACLDAVRPLEERMGWDGVDEIKATLAGWRTMTIVDLPFRHHRAEGARDGSRWRAWAAQGDAAYHMGYRLWYLAARSLHNARKEPSAVAMVGAYALRAVRRQPRCSDTGVITYVRGQQTLRSLPVRAREALGRRV